MKRKNLNKKLVLNSKTIANLDKAFLDDINGRYAELDDTTETNFMTCNGEDPCDTDRTCQDPNCQA
jgi:hypothetical protein